MDINNDDDAIDIDGDEDADNRDLLDSKDSQKLTHDEIEQLKQANLTGNLESKSLIKEIVSNSATFEGKTGFAKQKYLRRKEKKFLKAFYALEPSARNLCEYYFTTKPQRIREIRMDMLFQMLALANIHSGAKVLVNDSTGGLLLGAIMERNPAGTVLSVMDSETVDVSIMKQMNITPETLDTIDYLPVNWLTSPNEYEEVVKVNEEAGRMEKAARMRVLKSRLNNFDFDCFIAIPQYDCLELLNLVKDSVAGSRPIVIYSAYKEHLIPTFLHMRNNPEYINIQLIEAFTREFQVFGGLHPVMQASGSGGYILFATRVFETPKPDGSAAGSSGSATPSGSVKRTKLNNNNNNKGSKEPKANEEGDNMQGVNDEPEN